MKTRNLWVGFRTAWLFLTSGPKLRRAVKNNDIELGLQFMHDVSNKLIKSAGMELEVVGRENILIDENYVLIANHESYFDLLFICSSTEKTIGFVAKDTLGKIPIFKGWMKFYNCVLLDRDDLRAQVKSINEAAEVVKNKNSIGILPEGTRSIERGEFKAGSFKIAKKTKAPIVPTTVINSHGAYEKRTTNKKQKAKLIYHTPIYYEEYKDMKMPELAKHVEEIVYKDFSLEVES